MDTNTPLASPKSRAAKIGVAALYAVVFAMLCHLFFNHLRNNFVNDTAAHVETVLRGHAGYSLAHFVIGVCCRLPFPRGVLSVVLASFSLGTALGMAVYLRSRAGARWSRPLLLFLGLALVFTGNLWLPRLFPHFYTHYTKVSQPWHNSTYLLMRFFSVPVLALYFKLFDQARRNAFAIRDGLLFCAVLTLCNYAKPNFFLAFAPAALAVFAWLLVASRGKNAPALFKWGCCFILSAVCMVFMFRIVYEPGSHSSIAFSSENFVDYVFGNKGVGGRRGQFWICEFSNLCFPLYVLASFVVLKLLGRAVEFSRLLQGFLIFLFGHLEQLFLVEDGPRRSHGNYAWGVYGVGMLLFLVCLAEWLRAYDRKQLRNKWAFGIGLALFAAHILGGFVYFTILCRGLGFVL